MKRKLQQGDVLLKRVDDIPKGAKKVVRKAKGFVLAEGEVTGHAHVIVEDDIGVSELDGVMYIKTDKLVDLTHEEHGTITIEPGIWKRDIVKEFDAFDEEARNVKD